MLSLSFLKIWGCVAYVKRPISDKLAPKSIKCNFVGYPKETKGYYFYIPSENKVFVARNGTFLEKEFISQRFSGSTVRLEETQAPQESIEPPVEPLPVPQTVVETERVTQVPCRSDKTRHQPERYGFLMTDNRELLLIDEDESCVYKMVSGSAVVFLVLYVDDILLIGNDIPTLQKVKTWLGNSFSMKDLGEAAYILGIKIYRDRSKRIIGLSQSTYIDKVLKRFSMQDSKRGFLPMSHGIHLSKNQCPMTSDERERMNKIPYASAIGSIMYAMLCTRPDVSYVLSTTNRYQSDPGESHWTAVKNILKYLRRTKDAFLVYGGLEDELVVNCYTDASFQIDIDDFRSQSGFVFNLNGGIVSWKSSKHSTIADSTIEAEYIAASDAAKRAVWLKEFISELGMVPSIANPMDLYYGNNGAIAQAKEPRSHQRSKHILRRYHLIREIIDRGDIKICKVDTNDNIANPLTKPLSQVKHDQHTRSMGIRYLYD